MANIDTDVAQDKYYSQVVVQSREEYLKTFTSTSTCSNVNIPIEDISSLVTSVEEKLGLISDTAIYQNITYWSLWTASDLMTYLSMCPPKLEMDATRLELDKSIEIYSPKEILIILNRLLHAEGTKSFREEFAKFF